MMAQANGPTPAPPRRRSIRLRDYDYTRNGAYFVTICAYERWPLFGDIVDGEMRLNAWGEIVQGEWAQTAVVRDNVELDAFVVMPNHIHGIIVITDDDRARPPRHIAQIGDNPVGATRWDIQTDDDDMARATRRLAQPDDDDMVGATRWVAQPDDDDMVGASRWGIQPDGDDMVRATHRVAQTDNDDMVRASRRLAPTDNDDRARPPRRIAQPDGGRLHGPPSGSLGAIIAQYKSIVTKRIRRLPDAPDHAIWQRNYYEHIIRNEESLNQIRQYIINNPARWAEDSLYWPRGPTTRRTTTAR